MFIHNLILVLALVQTQSNADYKAAFELSSSVDEFPMVVVISASWCGNCKPMVEKVSRVYPAYVYLDIDKDKEARAISVHKNIPQVIVYKKKGGVWKRRFLVGSLYSEADISKLIDSDFFAEEKRE